MDTVLLGLGSNLGDRAANLRSAIAKLETAGVHTIRRSSLYQTAPIAFLDQPAFLNAVIEVSTTLNPPEVLDVIHRVESELGRVRTIRNGPRTIDIDILSWGGRVLRLPHLRIPHPAIRDRRFVLEPLAEVSPQWTHPDSGEPVFQLLDRVSDQSVTRLLAPL